MTILQLENTSDITPANIKKLQSLISSKNTILLNYATWCGHCEIFKSEWEQLKKSVGKDINMVQIESDALTKLQQDKKTYKRVTPKDGMVYFPMIIIFIKKNGKASEKKIYDGNRSAIDLNEFINSKVKSSTKTTKTLKGKTQRKTKLQKELAQSVDRAQTENLVPLTLQKLNDELNNILNQLRVY